MRTTQSLCTALLFLTALSWRADAHNGKVAEVIPLSDITIDGALDDWPERMRMYPVAWVHPSAYKPEPPTGPGDNVNLVHEHMTWFPVCGDRVSVLQNRSADR